MDVTSYLLGKKSGGGSKPPVLQDKEITINENGTTNITADTGYDGLSEVEVTTNVSSSIDDYFKSSFDCYGNYKNTGEWVYFIKKVPMPVTVIGFNISALFMNFPIKQNIKLNASNYLISSMQQTFSDCKATSIDISGIVSTGITNFYATFSGCTNLTDIEFGNFTANIASANQMFRDCETITELNLLNFDTTNTTTMAQMFYNCKNLITINCNFDFSSCKSIRDMFSMCNNLKNIGTLKNIGKAYPTTASSQQDYKLNLSYATKLTHDSLMNVINGLYDIASAGISSQQLVLGPTNLAKLTEEEIAIATNKGWAVS